MRSHFTEASGVGIGRPFLEALAERGAHCVPSAVAVGRAQMNIHEYVDTLYSIDAHTELRKCVR